MMDQFAPIHSYACQLGAAPRWRHVVKLEPHGHQATYNLIPFATKEAAQSFIERFGGRHFDPVLDRQKPKRQNVWTWQEWGSPAERYPEIIARLERVRSFEPPLDFDIAYLLDQPRVRFTYSQEDVEAFLAEAIPSGEWIVKQVDKGFDAGVRHSPDDGWRHACENRTSARDNPATALTLAYLRGMARTLTLPSLPGGA